jgi:hypothetical protein
VLVVVADSLVLPFEASAQQQLREASLWLLGPAAARANACFRVTAQRQVAGREYYPGIIPAGLTRVRTTGAAVEIALYRSPDGDFSVVVRRATSNEFVGSARQTDWNGQAWEAGEVQGRRGGMPDASRCHPQGAP